MFAAHACAPSFVLMPLHLASLLLDLCSLLLQAPGRLELYWPKEGTIVAEPLTPRQVLLPI